MQQYIIIPELRCIVRKIAPDGDHMAYFGLRTSSLVAMQMCYDDLLAGSRGEGSLIWDSSRTRDGYHPVTFKDQ